MCLGDLLMYLLSFMNVAARTEDRSVAGALSVPLRRILACAWTAGVVFLFVPSLFGQSADTALVEDVMERIFPGETSRVDFRQWIYAIDVTALPGSSSAIRIGIKMDAAGRIEAVRHSLEKSNAPLRDQIDALLAGGVPADAAKIAGLIRTGRDEVPVSSGMRSLIRQLPIVWGRPAKRAMVQLDGTVYLISYRDALGSMKLEYLGGEDFVRGEPPLVTWARKVLNLPVL
jgi:hypothetical protein